MLIRPGTTAGGTGVVTGGGSGVVTGGSTTGSGSGGSVSVASVVDVHTGLE